MPSQEASYSQKYVIEQLTVGNHAATQLWEDWLAQLPGSSISQSSASCVAVSSICAAPFSSTCSTQSDNNSRKLRLRCSCQFPCCALAPIKELPVIMIKTVLRKIRRLILTVTFFGTTRRFSTTRVSSLCLIKHRAMRTHDGVELCFHMFPNSTLDQVQRSASLSDRFIGAKMSSMPFGLKTVWPLVPTWTFP
jgi:hypothetical protein